ncbi:MAG: hypothetical protein RIR26_2833 [Pseudomonadota bacterium]
MSFVRLNFNPSFLVLSILSSSCIHLTTSVPSEDRDPHTAPRLVVFVIVDQMRGDMLDRFSKAFQSQSPQGKPEGLARFKAQGVSFAEARTASAPTVTAAGHASVCTGASPSQHGIVGNSYFDRRLQKKVEAVDDASSPIVRTPGLLPDDPLSRVASDGVSNRQLLAPSLADVLYRASEKSSKSFAVSLKDRGAVFCGGSSSAGVYWYDYKSGSMVSSQRFTPQLPAWVNSFNTKQAPDFNFTWTSRLSLSEMKDLLSEEKYKNALSIRSPLSARLGTGFPASYSTKGMGPLGARRFFELTPFASEHLVNFALEAVRQERLGCASRDSSTPCLPPAVPDFLSVSFSTPDIAGHAFGPESPEHFDIYLNLNKSVERLRRELESSWGEGHVLFVLTADHGVQSLPEVSSASGVQSGRLSPSGLKLKFEAALEAKFGVGPWIDEISSNEIYLNEATLHRVEKKSSEILTELRNIVAKENGLRGMLTLEDILKAQNAESEFFKRGHQIARSGDAALLVQPGWLGDDREAGNHGTSNDDDARIPIVFYGWKIPAGKSSSIPVRADDIAPTVLGLLGIPKGTEMTGTSRSNLVRLPANP